MRTRTRSVILTEYPAVPPSSFTTRYTDCSGNVYTGPDSTSGYPPFPTSGINERISDETGPGAHNVIHRKQIWEIIPATTTVVAAGPPYGTVSYGTAMAGEVAHYTKVWFAAFPDFDVMLNSGNPNGWGLNRPSLNDTSIINDLYQSGARTTADVLLNVIESNQLWPSLRSLATSLPNMAKNWNKIRRVLGTASSSYLAWKFGIGPVISDLSAISRFAPDINKRYMQYKLGKNIRQARLYVLEPTYSRPNVVIQSHNGVNTVEASYEGKRFGECSIRYVIVLKPTQSYHTDLFSRLDFLMRRFTTSPASLAWELVPFSFVLDWFVDVRNTLRAVDRVLGFSPYNILSASRSLTYHLGSEVTATWRTSCSSGSHLSSSVVGREECKHYERIQLNSAGIIPTLNGRFGKNQAAVTAALITQKLNR